MSSWLRTYSTFKISNFKYICAPFTGSYKIKKQKKNKNKLSITLIKWPKNAYVLGGTFAIFMGGCAAWTLDHSAYARASSAEASILD